MASKLSFFSKIKPSVLDHNYGDMCKTKCDDFLCAAKVIHPTLFDPASLGISNSTLQRTQATNHEISTRMQVLEHHIWHPNVIQYLGTHQDPEAHLLILLMELKDDSLTHFLESSTQPIPYYFQVNIYHNITLKLSSNGIIHRDFSATVCYLLATLQRN